MMLSSKNILYITGVLVFLFSIYYVYITYFQTPLVFPNNYQDGPKAIETFNQQFKQEARVRHHNGLPTLQKSSEINLSNLHQKIVAQEMSDKPFEPIIVKNVLNQNEMNKILQSVTFIRSETIGDNNNIHNTNKRDSLTGWYDNKDLITRLVKSVAPDKTYEHCEKLQVVKYNPGGFFVPHFDSTNDPYNNYTPDFKYGGHRIYTLLISITDPNDYEGGYTEFPNIQKKYKLNKGDGLLFRNIDKNNHLLFESKHGGQPVTAGTKYVCNLWIHVDRYNFDSDR